MADSLLQYYAFISYSHKDSAFAEKIAEAAQFLQVASPSQKGKAEALPFSDCVVLDILRTLSQLQHIGNVLEDEDAFFHGGECVFLAHESHRVHVGLALLRKGSRRGEWLGPTSTHR